MLKEKGDARGFKPGKNKCTVKRVKWPLSKRLKTGFQDQLSPNAGQGEHSAILSTFIKLPIFVIKIFVLSVFEQPFYYCKIRFDHYYCINLRNIQLKFTKNNGLYFVTISVNIRLDVFNQ